MSKQAEAIEQARREYVAAMGTSQETAKFHALMKAVEAAKGKR